MSKTDWKNNKLPFFNSNKLGTIVNGKIVDPSYFYKPGQKVGDEFPLNVIDVQDAQGGGGSMRNFMPFFVDGSDSLANRGFIVSFQHTPSDNDVSFKAFITTFNETYNCDWNSEQVFGRADPIYLFKQTAREITLALHIPAATESEAFENLGRVQRLVTFLYPTYSDLTGEAITQGNQRDTVNALTIANSPMVRLRVMNILAARPQIGDADGTLEGDGGRASEEVVYNSRLGTFSGLTQATETAVNTSAIGSQTIAENFHGGVLGVIKNLTVNHNLDNPDYGVFMVSNGTILPKMIEINLTFGVVHEHTLGWLPEVSSEGAQYEGQKFSNALFPYGVNHQTMEPKVANKDIAAKLANQSNARFNALEDMIDEFEEEKKQTEQDRMNANARYSGIRGRARFERDQSNLERLNTPLSDNASWKEKYRHGRARRQVERAGGQGYVESTTRGVNRQYDFDGDGDRFDDFIR